MSDWCILRTSGRHTLPLAESLGGAGLDVWTPVKLVDTKTHKTISPSRKQRARARVQVPAPLLPYFVFARARHAYRLLSLSSDPLSKHPAFSVFHDNNRIPVIADCELDGLRKVEAAERLSATKRKPQMIYGSGAAVLATEGAYAGLSGVVEKGGGKYTAVIIDGRKLKIATYLLIPESREAA